MKSKHIIRSCVLLITAMVSIQSLYAASTAWAPTWDSKLLSEDIAFPASPETEEEFRTAMEYAAIHQLSELTFTYPVISSVTSFFLDRYIACANQAHAQCYYGLPEYYGYRGTQVVYTYTQKQNTMELTVDFVEYTEEAKALEDSGQKAAEDILSALYANEVLTRDMTERDRAFVIMEWLSEHTAYSTTCPWSSTAWSALVTGQAACGGYTAAYDLLLKLDGIECHGQFGQANGSYHLWTVATLDGAETYIDTTWYDAILDLTSSPALYQDWYFSQDRAKFYIHHTAY